ncbi:MAG: hypothetical protein ACYDGY_09895 [Acidimicrobiales bacterium]
MEVRVVYTDEGHRLAGDGSAIETANQFLDHLEACRYSSKTVRAYAFDLL